jgi:hypothetical protein
MQRKKPISHEVKHMEPLLEGFENTLETSVGCAVRPVPHIV